MGDVFLLGPQSPVPNVRVALDALGANDRIAVVSAGWQEREGELEALRAHVDCDFEDLAIYTRCEAAFRDDRALFEAHRARQDTLIAMQRLYRMRLSHALAAAHELAALPASTPMLDSQQRAANAALRNMDRHHLRQIRHVHNAFALNNPIAQCASLRAQREAIAEVLSRCDAVMIAGGHVAVLLGRLRLIGFADLLADKPVIAWSAGAMAITERVVLFHDHPPQGAGDPEVLDAGLGLASNTVLLPHASERLALDDAQRVGIFARRFAPALSLTADNGALLHLRDHQIVTASGIECLMRNGTRVEVQAA